MTTAVTTKGQVTIPKRVRDALGLSPGSQVEFAVNSAGEVILRRADAVTRRARRDRFDHVRGRAEIKWRTDDLMRLVRGEARS